MKKIYLSLLSICLVPVVGTALIAANISHNTALPADFSYTTAVVHI